MNLPEGIPDSYRTGFGDTSDLRLDVFQLFYHERFQFGHSRLGEERVKHLAPLFVQLRIGFREEGVRSPERVVEGIFFGERINLAVDDLVQAGV